MKPIKVIILTLTTLLSIQAFAMEAPPQAPVKVAAARLLLPVKVFPPDIQRKLFPLWINESLNLYEVAETILSFAGTNKENQAYVNDNMIAILNSFFYTAKGIEIYKLLENKTVSLPVMQKPHMKIWLKDAQNRLSHGENLFVSICDNSPYSLERMKKLLKIKNVNLNHFHNGKYFTCLGFGVCYLKQKQVRLLLDAGANPNLTCLSGNTPLMWAMYSEDQEIVKMLLQAGANPDLKNMKRKGQTARFLALEKGLYEIASLLDAASLAKKQKLEERKKRLYGQVTESMQQNAAPGCVIS